MKINFTAESWLRIGLTTGWIKTAEDVISQLTTMLGQQATPISASPQFKQLKQQYQGILTEQQWVANFSQVLPQVASTIQFNIDSLNNMASKSGTTSRLLTELQAVQSQIQNVGAALKMAQNEYATTLQGMLGQVTELSRSVSNTTSGTFPVAGGTSNIPMGGAPAIPAH